MAIYHALKCPILMQHIITFKTSTTQKWLPPLSNVRKYTPSAWENTQKKAVLTAPYSMTAYAKIESYSQSPPIKNINTHQSKNPEMGPFWRLATTVSIFLFWFVVVQSLSCVWLFTIPCTAVCQASLSFTISQSLLNSCPLSQWCLPTITSSVTPFSSCLQSFLASGSFPMSWLFASGSQILELQHQSFQWIFMTGFL